MQPSDLPPALQYLAYIVFAILTGIGMFVGYQKKKAPEPQPNKDIILTGAGLVDMHPVRELVNVVEEIRDDQRRTAVAVEGIKGQLDEMAHEARVEREVKERLASELLKKRS